MVCGRRISVSDRLAPTRLAGPTARARHGVSSGRRSARSEVLQRDRDVQQHDDREHHDREAEVERERAEADRRQHPAHRLDRRIRHGEGDLGEHEDHAARPPLDAHRLDEVEHEPGPEDDEVDEEHDVEHAAEHGERGHAGLLRVTGYEYPGPGGTVRAGQPVKPASSSLSAPGSSPETAMCSGESRKTLLVTRSIRPRSPVESPEAKSTRRRASDSVIWVRLMMIGVPSRKCSAMPWASRYWRGCTVRISFISGTALRTDCRFGSGVTVARGAGDGSGIGSTGSS